MDTNFTRGAPYKIWKGKKCPKFCAILTTFDFDREYLTYWEKKISELWSTNQKVIDAHVDPPKWAFFVILNFGP